MNPRDIAPEERPAFYRAAAATGALTPLQREALEWWAAGAGYKRLAWVLGVPRDTARGRVERAVARAARALEVC